MAYGIRKSMNDAFSNCPALVVDHPLVQRTGHALGDPAVDLPLDDHRVDQMAAVVQDAYRRIRTSAVSGSVSTIAACMPLAKVDLIGE